MTCYQLPDLLTFLTSVLHSSDDGDLHINPFYDPNLSPKSLTLQTLLHRTATATKTNKLQKTPKELIQEYNPGLLASVYLPFTSILKPGCENEEAMSVVWEWLSVCALVVEETVRSGRIVGIEDDNECIRECLQEIANRLSEISYASHDETIDDYITEILNASNSPPSKPPPSNNDNSHITRYINWRINLSGLRVLSKLFLSPNHQHQYKNVMDLALQIIVCVTDLFAYNIHQAWHATTTNSTRNHLNIISFLLHGGRKDSEKMTLQAAIAIAGEMIRQRMTQLQTELYQTRNNDEGGDSGGILANIFSSFFTTQDSSSSTSSPSMTTKTKTETPNDDGANDKTAEIRKTIWNWVTGIIHWAYEVDYFSPDLEDDGDEGGAKKKKKRGSEIRDYGWAFLIPTEGL